MFLTHLQADKDELKKNGYGTGKGSKVLTINEAQGLTFKHIVNIGVTAKPVRIFAERSWAIVAISRHTDLYVLRRSSLD